MKLEMKLEQTVFHLAYGTEMKHMENKFHLLLLFSIHSKIIKEKEIRNIKLLTRLNSPTKALKNEKRDSIKETPEWVQISRVEK